MKVKDKVMAVDVKSVVGEDEEKEEKRERRRRRRTAT